MKKLNNDSSTVLLMDIKPTFYLVLIYFFPARNESPHTPTPKQKINFYHSHDFLFVLELGVGGYIIVELSTLSKAYPNHLQK